MVQHVSQSRSGKPDPDLEWVEPYQNGSASFGAKVATWKGWSELLDPKAKVGKYLKW